MRSASVRASHRGDLRLGDLGSQAIALALDDERIAREALMTLLPLYPLEAAAGYLGSGEGVEIEGSVAADRMGRLDDQMFVC